MNRFPGLPIKFFKIWEAYAANIELTQSCLADGEARDSQLVDAISAAVQECCTFQVGQEAVNCTYRQPRAARNLFGREAVRRLAEELQQAQSALQRRNVVAPFWMISH